jgi:hypothetical protein
MKKEAPLKCKELRKRPSMKKEVSLKCKRLRKRLSMKKMHP